MNCKKCGYILEANDRFCCNCGEKVEENLENVQSGTVKTLILPDAKEAPLPGTSNVENKNVNVELTNNEIKSVEQIPVAPVEQTPVASVEQIPVAPIEQTTVTPIEQNSIASTEVQVQQKQPSKKTNPIVIVIIVVLAIAAAGLLFFLLYGTNGLKKSGQTTTSSTTMSVTTSKKTTTTKAIQSSQIIGGIKVTIPSGWVYSNSTQENVGIIMNKSTGIQMNIYPIDNLNFEYCKNNSAELDNSLTQKGAQILNKNTTTYGTKEYLYYEIVYNNKNETVLFTSMPNGNTIRFEVMGQNVDLNNALEITNIIASSATKDPINQVPSMTY